VAQQLSLAARPKSLDQLVGQQKTIDAIRGHMKSGRVIKAWALFGRKGTGKTTTARILAVSYQCSHQKEFGQPCLVCRQKKSGFDIAEINASDMTGIDAIRTALQGSDYGVLGAGKYRVYILDEVHRLSDAAQNLLLKYLEDTPSTTIFILCSTAPQKILETLRSRCVSYEMKELEEDDITILVTRLLKLIKSKLPADRLVAELVEKHVASPRLIAQAVEKYAAGQAPEEAALVEGMTDVDISSLTRAMIHGDWPAVSDALMSQALADLRPVRIQVVAYLRTILLRDKLIGERTKVVADAITAIANLSGNAEDAVVNAAMAAELYRVTALFSNYKR
jgi:DNA polymerase III subunit gamma/tau